MKRRSVVVLFALALPAVWISVPDALGQASERPAGLNEDTAKAVPPFKMFDNLYYVGLDFVCAYLIRTTAGLILVDPLFGTTPDPTSVCSRCSGASYARVRRRESPDSGASSHFRVCSARSRAAVRYADV